MPGMTIKDPEILALLDKSRGGNPGIHRYTDNVPTHFESAPTESGEAAQQVSYRCGHIEPIPTYVDFKRQATWVANHADKRLCHSCWLQQQDRALADFDLSHDLPNLRGSEKQVAWARSIRMGMITDLQTRIEKAEELGRRTFLKKLVKALDSIKGVTDVKLWIDAKHLSAEAFYDDLIRMRRAAYFRKAKA